MPVLNRPRIHNQSQLHKHVSLATRGLVEFRSHGGRITDNMIEQSAAKFGVPASVVRRRLQERGLL